MNKNKIIINFEDLPVLIENGNKILLNPQGEEFLLKLLKLQKQVEHAIDFCKDKLTTAIQEVNPDLTSITSDNVKVMYRMYGSKYGIDNNLIEFLNKRFYTTKTTYQLNPREVEKEISETGVIPTGIKINDRKKTVSITLKNQKEIKDEN
jgi:hypothetical protein